MPYHFQSFNLYTRIGADARDYIGFDSLTEQFHFIVRSLFKPNRVEGIDLYWSILTGNNGVCKGSIDDSFFVHKFIKEYNTKYPQSSLENVLINYNDNPSGFYIKWLNGSISALLYGGYINHRNIEQVDWEMGGNTKAGEWFIFKYTYENPSNPNYSMEWRTLLESVITTIKDSGALGILTLWWQEDGNCGYKSTLISLGFKPESPTYIPSNTKHLGRIMQYRLTFETTKNELS